MRHIEMTDANSFNLDYTDKLLRTGYASMKVRLLITLMLSAAAAFHAHGQDMNALWQDGAFEIARTSIEALEPESRRDQTMAVWMTMVGREDLQATIDGPIAGQPQDSCFDNETTKPAGWTSAGDWIIDQADDHRVVMFNENHYRVGARALVLGLLPQLRELGFTHIGFEAFNTPEYMAGQAREEGREDWAYAPESGFYTHEPLFAALIRGAHELGFEVFGYEAGESAPEDADIQEQIAFREQAQADNLMAALDEAGDQARFVIFAGWSHIAKAPLQGGQRWMAARFKEASDIDPLSVDLTTCTKPGSSSDGFDHARLPLDDTGQPIVIGHYAGAVDAQVHMPVPEEMTDSAGFYRQVLGRPIEVPETLLSSDEPVLVRARRTDREATAVPDDQVLIKPGESLYLYLPDGYEYHLTGHRGDGSLVGEKRIRVEVSDPDDV